MSSLRAIFLSPLAGGVISIVGGGGKTTLMFGLARKIAAAGETVLTTTTTKILMPGAAQSAKVILSPRTGFILERARLLLDQERHLTAGRSYLPGQNKLTGYSSEEIGDLARENLFRWILIEADGARHRPLKAPAVHEPVISPLTHLIIAVVGLDVIGKPLTEEWVFRSQLFSHITGLKAGAAVTERSIAAILSHEQGIMKGAPAGALRYVFLNKAETEKQRDGGQRIIHFLRGIEGMQPDRVIIGSLEQGGPFACHNFSRQGSRHEHTHIP